MDVQTLVASFQARGVRLIPNGPRLTVEPASKLTDADRQVIRARKAELLAHLRAEQEEAEIDRRAQADAEHEHATADKALALLNRLKCFTLPAGRMPAARELALWLEPLKNADPRTILTALQGFERELIGLGVAVDPELLEAVAIIERTFPGARLVEVRRKLQ